MKTILVLGAGRSSASLITYLLEHAYDNEWQVVVGDASLEAAQQKVGNHARGRAMGFNIYHEDSIHVIEYADVVISLLPPTFHPLVAMKCIQLKKHLLTASYVSDEMRGYDTDAKAKGLLFLNECGVDPGIDHMSAMQVFDRIKREGGKIISFESFTGGLIAPETDPQNPWRYKFTWNPRNVVLAGQSTAKFLQDGKYRYIPYQQLFRRTTRINVPGHGDFEGYANRDSLSYISTYGLEGIQTMLRGTLRHQGYCAAWNLFVQLGCCDDTYEMEGLTSMTHASFLDSFLSADRGKDLPTRLAHQLALSPSSSEIEFLRWSGFFDEERIGLSRGTPAQVLEHILNKKWKLSSDDKDQIVMWHRFIYSIEGRKKEIQASLVATGTNATNTAMAQTVGLPLGIATKLLIQGKFKERGVVIPIIPTIYTPILEELKTLGIELNELDIM